MRLELEQVLAGADWMRTEEAATARTILLECELGLVACVMAADTPLDVAGLQAAFGLERLEQTAQDSAPVAHGLPCLFDQALLAQEYAGFDLENETLAIWPRDLIRLNRCIGRFQQTTDGLLVFRTAPDSDPRILPLIASTFSGEQGIPEHMLALPAEQRPRWWCAYMGERLVGTVAGYFDGDDFHMGRFAVDPTLRGHKIGKQLVEFAFTNVFESDIVRVDMECRDVTVKILLKMGAQISGEVMEFFGANATPMVMHKADYFIGRDY